MKRTLSITLVSLLAASTLAAQVYPALTPKNAKSMALGGSFTSIPTAEFSFFGNPAAFAAPKASITLISADTWAYIKPTFSNIAAFTSALQKSNPLPALAAMMLPTNWAWMYWTLKLSSRSPFQRRSVGRLSR